jgi:Glycosyl transferase family 2
MLFDQTAAGEGDEQPQRRPHRRRRCVVAIPAKDEAERLPVAALSKQVGDDGQSLAADQFEVVVFANNCRDGTREVVRRLCRDLPFHLELIEAELPTPLAHAGEARRRAMAFAAARLESAGADGVILTTDADSRVPQHWLARNLREIDAGADAVLGRLALDEEGARLPLSLHQRGALEDEYEGLLAEIAALLDPVPWNPWPFYTTISGASIAIRASAFREVGGVPRVPLGEDKALIAALTRMDAKIRFSNQIEVVTSARLTGRAVGGVADTLRLRSRCPDAFCDEALEPVRTFITRLRLRGQLRQGWPRALEDSRWLRRLAVEAELRQEARRSKAFGAAWEILETMNAALQRQLLKAADLPSEIGKARAALRRLKRILADPISTPNPPSLQKDWPIEYSGRWTRSRRSNLLQEGAGWWSRNRAARRLEVSTSLNLMLRRSSARYISNPRSRAESIKFGDPLLGQVGP